MAMCVFNCLFFLPAHATHLMHTQYSLEPSGKIRFRIQFKEHWGGKDKGERGKEGEVREREDIIQNPLFCYVFNTEQC